MIRIIKYLIVILIILYVSGCGFKYEKNANTAYSKLKIGMAKSELDILFKDAKFLKEQTIIKYPGVSEDGMKASLFNNKSYEELHPKDIFKSIAFEGNVRVFSYLIKKELNWPNGWYTYYVAVFYDKSSDRVIGWGKLFTIKEVRNWRNNF